MMLGRPAEVVLSVPLGVNCTWRLEVLPRVAIRQYVVNDTQLADSGARSVGAFISTRYATGHAAGSTETWTEPDYNLLFWSNGRHDHDGNTADLPRERWAAFGHRGFVSDNYQ